MAAFRRRLHIAAIVKRLIGLAVLAFAAIALLVGLLSYQFWPADLLTFAWSYVLATGLAILILTLWTRRPVLIAIAVAGIAISAWPIYALPTATEASGPTNLKIVTANLFVENARPPAEFVAFLRSENPDIVVLQETTGAWQDAIVTSGLFPYESSRILPARDHMKVFSRRPILSETSLTPTSVKGRRLKQPLRLTIDTGARPLVLYAIHPDTPRTLRQWHDRNDYLALTADSIRNDPKTSDIIVAGDWNTPLWSPYFRNFLRDSALVSTARTLLPAITRFSLRLRSYLFIGAPIDHVTVSPGVALRSWRTGPEFGSNHLPVLVELEIGR
ncbi:endonuclease/exonuclease/phosphatase (EEP) superfamily protein YafD [Rhizobium subbaraonis]|uniref:Endonuclease/exonuclease/phosphatase (EEP) superfamily protein YafD n=1 Tax=Rhizobium subbaraonis TaxID=908946 RepID=A0A285UVU6_9HYPH|nr:endonuclease/exonuclease/phosphatase family protein [Rhizobium subbaraonis]SOC45939.1 endonuclease/exonuclease/phosphatase (EEP) superfamily protein YafD [Rhizobium subbaraonis]